MQKIKDLKEYHKNPRKITDEDFRLLETTLDRYGDLSGVVVNVRTGELVGGHRRTDVFKGGDAEIVIEHTYDEPTQVGTVAVGHIDYKGERFSYREVDWDDLTAEGANIAANKVGGVWDWDKLANEFKSTTLLENGFKEHELGFPSSGGSPVEPGSDEKDLSGGAKTEHQCPNCGYEF